MSLMIPWKSENWYICCGLMGKIHIAQKGGVLYRLIAKSVLKRMPQTPHKRKFLSLRAGARVKEIVPHLYSSEKDLKEH